MGGGTPSQIETDYSQVWRNYGQQMKELESGYARRRGLTRARMAQSGVARGSSAWNKQLEGLDQSYRSDLEDIRTGSMATLLREGFDTYLRGRDVQRRQYEADVQYDIDGMDPLEGLTGRDRAEMASTLRGQVGKRGADVPRVTVVRKAPFESVYGPTYKTMEQWAEAEFGTPGQGTAQDNQGEAALSRARAAARQGRRVSAMQIGSQQGDDRIRSAWF